MPIHRLPERVSSAIAAGEVVERPASVVKELVENALDAGAKSIEIHIQGGGRSSIEVIDDGCGIDPDEIGLAVSRFTTSKLTGLEDLYDLNTLGFRGEALASIGAVSRMEITSRSEAAETAIRLEVTAGKVGHPHKIAAPQGTQVRATDLFHNVPARLKFLKTENTERRWITKFVNRYALAYPKVRFRFTSNGRESFYSSGNGDRLEILASIYGVEVAGQFIPLPEDQQSLHSVNGYIGPPTVNRSNRGEITIFVNGRWIQDIGLTSAVVQAYHALIMVGRFPIAALFLNVPPMEVDVNVHPAKAEVRFSKPDLLFSVVQRAVRGTLLNRWSVPSFSSGWSWSEAGPPKRAPAERIDWRQDLGDGSAQQEVALDGQPRLQPGSVPLLRAVGQVGACYLVAEGPDGIYLIDQHAAHERVLFERLMHQVREGALEMQALLEGITVELPPHQATLLSENLETLRSLGFDIEPFGANAYRLRSVPALLSGVAPDRAVRAIVEDFEEDEKPLAGAIEAMVAARVCKAAAIKAGQVLSLEEQRQLLRDLESCHLPRTCPHGRPTMIHLSVTSLERRFGRQG